MNLCEMFNELLSIPPYEINVQGYDTSKINHFRMVFIHSWRNTINKEIEDSFNVQELKKLIDDFNNILELPLLISLYRRYLWFQPTDKTMYLDFIKDLGSYEQEKQKLILNYINAGDFDSALTTVEEIFNSTFVDTTLIPPIKQRRLVDMLFEWWKLEDDIDREFVSMKQTRACDMRCAYLIKRIDERIADKNINPLELREYFTDSRALYILSYYTIGLKLGQLYFNINPTDREAYGPFYQFLRFWGCVEEERLILKYIAVNDFDKALQVVNTLDRHEATLCQYK